MTMNEHLGSRLDDLLDEAGLLAETEVIAIKRVIAYRLEEAMRQQGLSKAELARRMGSSRGALDRLLDPDHPSVTLTTLEKAAKTLGRRLRIELAA